ncbi:putative holin-like toxin [Cohnella pontilimi]|nr:putative holin-like toxin [Cohnella pontilimi]
MQVKDALTLMISSVSAVITLLSFIVTIVLALIQNKKK